MSCLQAFETMCKKIIAPTRHPQIIEKDIIERKFRRNLPNYQLFSVLNDQGFKLSVIAFINDPYNLPTVVYLHGNGGHKMQAMQLLSSKINIIAFDFRACGKSQGLYLTYGQRQVKDLSIVVNQARKRMGFGKIALWGRSMGASVALMFASLYPKQISSLVLDTPFRQLKQIVRNVAEYNNKSMPGFIIGMGIYLIQGKVNKLAGHNIFQTDFLNYLNLLEIPALFAYSPLDVVVKQENVKELFESYQGSKTLTFFQALHHQDRPSSFIELCHRFVSEQASKQMNQRRGLSMSLRGKHSLQ